MRNTLMAAAVLMILVIIMVSSSNVFAQQTRMSRSFIGRGPQLDPKKRPFCNAFTGCGRKRSESPSEVAPIEYQQSSDESISSLLDLNAEPAVEDLSRQIMSEAKLWEAIQEANKELLRRKQHQADEGNAIAGMGVGGKCGLSGCFI